MWQVAVLDDRGVLQATVTVDETDYVTDPARRTVQLPRAHDMTDKVGRYAWDWNMMCFLPISRAMRGPYRG